ncbi:uncharacterized protein BDW43DRAFT_241732 [Aspergillus alliaceus]|uniref:uncharacterized protein n=1 Tax=Petromyces alliaceus TaxID=209559 RepID=UPI0012A671D2|nr:uncharacterized protein BDW43DRAFT_241732 [Aspergillus alliaceus]KAB8236660.1 hypothetical protein BDW43DRAFT_241732 [Aspergillus alliaceus]
MITFYMLQDKRALQRVRQELSIVPIQPTEEKSLLSQLGRLPYLNAVISKVLHLMRGVTTRLPWLAHKFIKYNEWIIPSKTPLSQANKFVHTDPRAQHHPSRNKRERKGELACNIASTALHMKSYS